jgi:hypothetical protein
MDPEMMIIDSGKIASLKMIRKSFLKTERKGERAKKTLLLECHPLRGRQMPNLPVS